MIFIELFNSCNNLMAPEYTIFEISFILVYILFQQFYELLFECTQFMCRKQIENHTDFDCYYNEITFDLFLFRKYFKIRYIHSDYWTISFLLIIKRPVLLKHGYAYVYSKFIAFALYWWTLLLYRCIECQPFFQSR